MTPPAAVLHEPTRAVLAAVHGAVPAVREVLVHVRPAPWPVIAVRGGGGP